MAVKITLTRGFEAIIDDEDLARVSKLKWHVSDTKTGTYAVAWMRAAGKSGHIYLHRFLLSFPEGRRIKFINGNTLDCRRENLKVTTASEIHAGRKIGPKNRSGFKGVSFNKASGKFKAYIRDNGKLLYLGLFVTDIGAARAYNEKARELRGESAYLNQIDEEISNV